MPKRIAIKEAKAIADKLNLQQVILVAFDGDRTHVVTYGKSKTDCAQAALGGNIIKKAIGFPAEMTNTVPSRLKERR